LAPPLSLLRQEADGLQICGRSMRARLAAIKASEGFIGFRTMLRFLLVAATLLPGALARADDLRQIDDGRKLVEENCARCHAVTSTDKSSHPDAPPFRTLSTRYPIEDLAEALAEGISTGHPDMPEFVAAPEQVDAIIAYIRSINP
jgi:mono/diheme cytochrome c family protein